MTELERSLVALGRELDVPAAPDVAAAVLGALERRAPAPRRRRRLAAAVAVAALALLAAALAIPDARSALFRVLHVGGERIELVDELPDVVPEPAGLGLDLGERVSLTEARRRAGFDLRALAGQPAPDRVYLGPHGTVWLLWGSPTRVRLLLAQTPLLRVEEQFLLKKVAPATSVRTVEVGDATGYFLSGAPHFVILVDEAGGAVEETAWLARNVLVWEEDRVAIRLEGDLTEEQAVELARALR